MDTQAGPSGGLDRGAEGALTQGEDWMGRVLLGLGINSDQAGGQMVCENVWGGLGCRAEQACSQSCFAVTGRPRAFNAIKVRGRDPVVQAGKAN